MERRSTPVERIGRVLWPWRRKGKDKPLPVWAPKPEDDPRMPEPKALDQVLVAIARIVEALIHNGRDKNLK